jgi:hypothetical protein
VIGDKLATVVTEIRVDDSELETWYNLWLGDAPRLGLEAALNE